MKPKRLAKEIVDRGLTYALDQEKDPEQRIKAYRKVAKEFNELADEMERELL